ncbi:hypothetical protein CRX42_09890 [Pseudomonas jessenii]|uniref:Uncharacterized protein n=1 Tax=Pseudomonas jessenii TaxID=77298 RepID=A0A2W0ES32_PSEJE|nr:hypothetical protein [Pseudomonas jessenii]PYY70727.1 hypothetical protein CRX42_09890 [Pseudomonas jessenii]
MPEEMKKAWPEHYRYIDTIGPEGLEVHCITYQVIGETAQCYYIGDKHTCDLVSGPQYSWTDEAVKKRRKRVLKEGGSWGRRFAYTDKALALRSYKARKSWQMRHAQLSMERAQAAIGYFGNLEVESTIPAGAVTIPSEYIQGLSWGDY